MYQFLPKVPHFSNLFYVYPVGILIMVFHFNQKLLKLLGRHTGESPEASLLPCTRIPTVTCLFCLKRKFFFNVGNKKDAWPNEAQWFVRWGRSTQRFSNHPHFYPLLYRRRRQRRHRGNCPVMRREPAPDREMQVLFYRMLGELFDALPVLRSA
jgi:hypothetical protein